MRLDEIVGYTYQAAHWCPDCLQSHLAATWPRRSSSKGARHATVGGYRWEIENLPGWNSKTDFEDVLTYLAIGEGIDREDGCSFDTDDFPKVILAGWCEGEDVCEGGHHSQCGRVLPVEVAS